MSTLRVTNLKGGSAGSAPNLPDGATVTGVVTATSFSGSGANLTGIDATALKDGGGSVKVQATATGAVITGVLTAPTVSATTGSFTGNVSVGGTLTYEDVTNVDSVGLITARNGVNISGSDLKVGVAFTVGQAGVVTATSFVGNGANLTNLPPGGNTVDLVADGAIAAGKPVIITTAGKAAQVVETLSPTNPYVAQGDVTNNDIKGHVSMAYHQGLDKYVIIGASGDAYWQTASNNGANTSITFGTRFLLMGYALQGCMACYDENNQRVIFMWWNSQFGTTNSLMVATHGPNLNGADDFNANNSYHIGDASRPIAAVYYSEVNICCFMVQQNNNSLGILYMLDTTVSSTVNQNLANKRATITLDSSASIQFGGLATNGNVIVVAYKKGSNSGIAYKIITGTNATTYTTTSEATFTDSSITMEEIDITYDSNAGKFVLVYKNAANNYLKAVVGTLSGTGSGAAISWGTPVQMSTDAMTTGMSCKYDTSRKDTLVVYDVGQTGYARYISISGTTPTWGAAVTVDSTFFPITARGNHFGIVRNPDTHQMLTAWTTASGNSQSSSSRYELITGASVASNLVHQDHYIGFADQAYSDGQTATIKTYGNNVNTLSGLTAGTKYFVQGDGTLATTADSSLTGYFVANTPVAGTALSSTKLLIRDPTVRT